ncbi:MAG: hypothetical protein PHW62_06545, partial [Candidatus Ratteibacteria bacterium]|nr:hypothetical protein [Candidatus Ratteibacteria bacterium]
PNMKIAQKVDLEKIIAETGDDSKQKNADPSTPFQSLKRNSISYMRTEKIDGKEVYIFQGTPEIADVEEMSFVPEKLEIGIYADSGMISKMVMINKEGKEMMSQTYSNIRLNIDIPDSEFEFSAPGGVQVIDITKSTLNMMKQTGEEEEQIVQDSVLLQ